MLLLAGIGAALLGFGWLFARTLLGLFAAHQTVQAFDSAFETGMKWIVKASILALGFGAIYVFLALRYGWPT